MSGRSPVILCHVYLEGDAHLMIAPVDCEDAMYVHVRRAMDSNFSIHLIGTKNDLRVLCGLQDFPVHLSVAHADARMGGGGVHHYFAIYLSGGGIVGHLASLQGERPVHRMHYIAKSEGNRRSGRKKFKNHLGSLGAAPRGGGEKEQHHSAHERAGYS